MWDKWNNLSAELKALTIVILCGAFGALLSCWWNLSIGEDKLVAGVASLSWFLRIFLGIFGAAATVFVVAKTDQAKLIHCGIIAALAGMAGPYLVIKALGTVMNVNPNLVQIGSAISVVQSTTTTLNNTIQGSSSVTNPQKVVDVVDQAAQATTSYLNALKNAPESEKQRALADTTDQFRQTLKALDSAASIVPKQSAPLIKKLATAAREAGAPAVAEEAQKILDTNSAVRMAVETAENIGKVYFITPAELTDEKLQELHYRIRTRFSVADIQPAVHPNRQIENGLEIVYYRDLPSDKETADVLANLVTEYLRDQNIGAPAPRIRKGSSDQVSPPFQFDIHIGPDMAAALVGIGKATPATPKPQQHKDVAH
jgi:hypothetical protein